MRHILSILTAALLLMSCEKELDFHYHDIEPQTVIEAILNENGTNVAITNTTPMDEPMDRKRLTDAQVELTDINTGETRKLTAGKDGAYTDEIPGETGHEYRIRIKRDGKSYESRCTMRQPTEIRALDFKWIKMPYDYVATLQVSFTDPDSREDFFWVRLFRNGEPYMWTVADDTGAADGMIHTVIRTSRKELDKEDDKTALRDGDEVKVAVIPVSRAMADYLNAIGNDGNGPRMFEGDFCLGYFLAAYESWDSIIYRPDEMEEYR